MRTAQQTDTGHIRMINEDRFAVHHDLHGYTLAIVADGMGGHQAGDVASQMAVDLISDALKGLRADMTAEEYSQAVKAAIETANERIFEFASQQEKYRGMGTTVVVALASPESLVIGHIGDSRAYLVQDDRIIQLTEDHTLVNELVRTGQISAEEASTHPHRHVITRALGTEPAIAAELNRYTWKAGDIVLLCSDGLSGSVGQDTLLNLIRREASLEEKVRMLVDEALSAGGEDNITAVLLANEQANEDGEG
jgi:protein phosphatase